MSTDSNLVVCGRCQRENRRTLLYCEHCGANLHMSHAPSPENSEKPSDRKDGSPWPMVIALILTLLGFALLLLLAFFRQLQQMH